MQRVESDLGNRSYAATGSGRSILGEPEKIVAAVALAEELLITEKKTWLAENNLARNTLSNAECEERYAVFSCIKFGDCA